MELFKLFGTIAVENSDANHAIDSTTNKAEDAHPKISTAFSKIGNAAVKAGQVIASGLAVGTAAMAGLTTKALSLGGELEQNMGGSEAVFGEYAKGMQETADGAFSDMGLSASDFLATANKMGALFQGAGFDIEESVNLSTAAMQRAADVASIMGIDTSDAMEAIAGAAKGNFTMMDNLGVAMNDTAIQNYALSKGIEKSTAEMTQQEKIGLAMEMFLEKTAYAAGNYSKENETLAGSLGTAKAALSNFLSGAGDADSLAKALLNAGSVVTKKLQTLLPQLVNGLNSLVTNLIPHVAPMLQTVLPSIIDGATTLIDGLTSVLLDVLPEVVDAVAEFLVDNVDTLLESALTLLMVLVDAVGEIIEPLLEALPGVIETITQFFTDNVDLLFEAAIALLMVLIDAVPEIVLALADALPTIVTAVVDTLMENKGTLLDGAVQLFMALVEAVPEIIASLAESLGTIVTTVVDSLIQPIDDQVIQPIKQLFEGVWKDVSGFFTNLWNDIVMAFEGAGTWFDETVIQPVTNFFSDMKESVSGFFTDLWDDITGVFEGLAKWFDTNVIQPITGFFKDLWTGIEIKASRAWDGVKGIWSDVTSFFENIFSDAWKAVKKVFSTVGEVFIDIKDGIVHGFVSVVNAIIGGINKAIALPFNAINDVLNTLRGVDILGLKPFGWIGTIKVPEIPKIPVPELEKGGVLERGQIGLLEGNGAEAVVPLDQNKAWISAVAKDMGDALGGYQMKEAFDAFVRDLPEMLMDAFASMKFDVNNREFARMVKAVN